MTTPIPAPYKPSQLEKVNAVGAAGAAQTIADPTGAGAYTINRLVLSAAVCALTFPAPQAGMSFTVELVQDATGGRTVTWPASVKWPAGTAPTLTTAASKADVFSFMCSDGATFRAFAAGLNF